MTPAVYPITGKVYYEEGDNISKPCSSDMNDCNLLHQPAIGNDGNGETKYIFCDIGNATAEAGNHVHIADSIFLFSPAPPFFK